MLRSYRVTPITLGYASGALTTRYEVHDDNLIYSVGNPHKKGKPMKGSGFLVNHLHETISPGTLPEYTHNGIRWGGLTAPFNARGAPPVVLPSQPSFTAEESSLRPFGATGFKRARPDTAEASFAQYAGEAIGAKGLVPSFLKGPLKTMPLRALRMLTSFRQLGSAYLQVQFGWKPFVQDLQKMDKLRQTLDKKLATLRNNNGKGIRRRRVLQETNDSAITSGKIDRAFGFCAPTPILNISPGASNWETISTDETRIWYAASFRYYVPNIGTDQWTQQATKVLYGLNVTPDVLWELVPWSWLADWFSNAGDVISNMSSASAVSNLVAQYQFVMREVKTTQVTTVKTSWAARTSAPAYPAGSTTTSFKMETIKRTRIIGSPYGFGVTYGSLSGYQQSILAALAISRKSFL